MKRIIVAGGRDFTDGDRMAAIMDEHVFCRIGPVALLSGKCPTGADKLAEEIFDQFEDPIVELRPFPADWDKHGRAAGPIRNSKMADNGDILIAFWDGDSRGTKDMINKALLKGLEVHVYRY